MISKPISDNHRNAEPLDRNLGAQYERVARVVNARQAAGAMLRSYRKPPTLLDRMDDLERQQEAIKAALYELLRRAA